MPRGRFLSKDISLDEKVNALSDDTARLLFTWLIPHLDCEGRLHGDPTTVKSIVFPRRKISVQRIDKYLNEIEKLGLLLRYSINGNTYLFAPHFEKHQMGLQKSKEARSQIPPPTPELLKSSAGISPPQVKAKVKAKVEVEDTTPSFIAYKEKLRITYPKLDIEEEWERCQIWYRDHNKLIKSPSLALGNWCKKEMEIQAEKGKPPGKNAGVNRINTDDSDKYIKGKYGHMVRR